jgi:hypothetical protein
MRLEFSTKAAAQAECDTIHAQMVAIDPGYAASVAKGQITAWAKPYQDLDLSTGLPINSLWYVNTKDRCKAVLTASEKTALKPYAGESKLRDAAAGTGK